MSTWVKRPELAKTIDEIAALEDKVHLREHLSTASDISKNYDILFFELCNRIVALEKRVEELEKSNHAGK